VAIVGPGVVGATTAYSLVLAGVAGEIILIGRDHRRVHGQVHDLLDATLYTHPTRVRSGDFADAARADVIVVTAGISPSPAHTSRLEDLRGSAAILQEVVAALACHDPQGVLVVASNPVDVLTHASWKWSRLPPGRVIGSGTALDTSRFRWRLAQRYRVAPADVQASVLGEHGDSQVALLSGARIAGTPLQEFCRERMLCYDEAALRKIAEEARTGGLEIIRSKGATCYGISAALTRIVGAILRDERAVLTISTLAPERMGLGQVYLSLPAILGREGVAGVLPVSLSQTEHEALRRSADVLKHHVGLLQLPQ